MMLKKMLCAASLLAVSSLAFAKIEVLEECRFPAVHAETGESREMLAMIARDSSPILSPAAQAEGGNGLYVYYQMGEEKSREKIMETSSALKGSDDFLMISDYFSVVAGFDMDAVTEYKVYNIGQEGSDDLQFYAFAYQNEKRLAGMGVLGWLPVVCAPHVMAE